MYNIVILHVYIFIAFQYTCYYKKPPNCRFQESYKLFIYSLTQFIQSRIQFTVKLYILGETSLLLVYQE